jgi:hypothetical protein
MLSFINRLCETVLTVVRMSLHLPIASKLVIAVKERVRTTGWVGAVPLRRSETPAPRPNPPLSCHISSFLEEKCSQDKSQNPVRQQALAVLIAQFIEQGHPPEYAQHIATATIFQADLELRNAQLVRLLDWMRQEYPNVYRGALTIIEETREDFEKRVHS